MPIVQYNINLPPGVIINQQITPQRPHPTPNGHTPHQQPLRYIRLHLDPIPLHYRIKIHRTQVR